MVSQRDISPISHSRTFQLSSTASSKFFKNPKSATPLQSSSSLEVIHSGPKIIERSEKRIISPRKVQKRPVRKMTRPVVAESVTVRESSRIKENPKRFRADIERIWRKAINCSNGVEPLVPHSAVYTVFIGKGNNSPMINKLFAARNWWKVVETKESANFVWSQWKDRAVLASLGSFNDHALMKEVLAPSAAAKTAVTQRVNSKDSEIERYGIGLIKNSRSYLSMNCEKIYSEQQRLHNKLEFNQCLSNKKGLYATMKAYYQAVGVDIFTRLPITFNVTSDSDEEYLKFMQKYQEFEEEKTHDTSLQNIWIIKPGEYTNRGNGITVCQALSEIAAIVKPALDKSYIIQKYIEKPLLVNKRKFDIRCYAMITSIQGVIQGYFYLDGYLRTTSKEYSCKEISNPFIHLTNDAIQKHSAEYGKFENGNKMSYREFQRYLDNHFSQKKVNFIANILPEIKEIVRDTMKASFLIIDKNKRMHGMEIFGYDFMIDREFKPWLIEVNTNPCLELASPHLRNIIPAMVENALKITVDSLFPPSVGVSLDTCAVNKFELIFHQNIEGAQMLETYPQFKEESEQM